jgi:hypothetical protein
MLSLQASLGKLHQHKLLELFGEKWHWYYNWLFIF